MLIWRRMTSGCAASFILGFVAVLSCMRAVAAQQHMPTDSYPAAAKSYLLLRDGQVLWQHQPDKQLPAASLAKLLTALVVLDHDFDAQRWLPVSRRAAHAAPTRVGLQAGEQVSAAGALSAMLIHSANDACRVLVDSTRMDDSQFAEAMNALATQLGMTASRFVDPCGFDAPNQYSTAHDLLLLAQAVARHALLATLVSQPSGALTVRTAHSQRRITFQSTNALIAGLPGTVGMKTGYTRQAGQCLIARVVRDGHEVWLVMLGSEQRWWLAHGIINHAFETADNTH